jgi:hypothetical protein
MRDSVTGIATVLTLADSNVAFVGKSAFVFDTSTVDTAWVSYPSPTVPGTRYLTIHFHNDWRCSDWTDTRVLKLVTPPLARLELPASVQGSCSLELVRAWLQTNDCQSIVIDRLDMSGISTRLRCTSVLPDTLGLSNSNLEFEFDPRDTVASGTAAIRVHGYYLGSDVMFDTTLYLNYKAMHPQARLLSDRSYIDNQQVSFCAGLDTAITYFNTGCDTITIYAPAVAASWNIVAPSFPLRLGPQDSVVMRLRFSPSSLGYVAQDLEFDYDEPVAGRLQSEVCALRVTVIEPPIVLTCSSASVSAGERSICDRDTLLTLNATNNSCDSIEVFVDALAGDTAWTTSSLSTDTTLAPGSTLEITYRFSPRLKGAHTASQQIELRSLRTGKIVWDTTVNLWGTGVSGRGQLALGVQQMELYRIYPCESRDTSIWVYNTGCDTLTIGRASVVGVGVQTISYVPSLLAPNDSAELRLRFDTTGIGVAKDVFDTLVFESDGGHSEVPLHFSIKKHVWAALEIESDTSARAGSEVRFRLHLTGELPTEATSLHFDLMHNDDLLNFEKVTGDNLAITNTTGNQAQVQSFTLSPVTDTGVIGELRFNTYLATAGATALALSHLHFDYPTLSVPPDCIASLEAVSANFTIVYECVDSLLQHYLGKLTLTGQCYPNPVSSTLLIPKVRGSASDQIELQVADAKGAVVLTKTFSDDNALLAIEASSLSAGSYTFVVYSKSGPIGRGIFQVIH